MDFELTADQRLIRDTVRGLATAQLQPMAARYDEAEEYPYENLRKLAELGLMGTFVPEEYGGAHIDTVSYALAVEEISRACAATGLIMSIHNSLVCHTILLFGNEKQRRRFLPTLARGEKIGAFALTEPNAGSDVASMETTAVSAGEQWVINGSKIFITSGAVADVLILFASTDRSLGAKGISAFIIEKGTLGFSIGSRVRTMGMRASGTAELVFQDCRLPKENLLGEPGGGFRLAMQALDCGRIGIAAQAVGIAQACFEDSVKYAKERHQFGKPIAEFQAIQWPLAEMATEIAAARLLTLYAASLKDKGQRFTKEAAMAKLCASDTAMRAATRAVQIHGGYGYAREYPIQRYFRDARITQIYEGTNEVQRMVIAANILK
ncbi:MAG: acyl-CoA dehydrogenase [Chloroflexi bacterium]|nr:acyl-CoA dehydrogenase [Chloroflexota bacterium]MCL5074781.1 acyl-CoA dehydrogenase [Chloroflexota bacterium]